MSNNKRGENQRENRILWVKQFSRRQFLKHAVVAAGVAIAALPAACKSLTTTKTTPETSTTQTSLPGSSNPTPTSSNSSLPASSSTNPATNTTVTGPPTAGYSYVAPTVLPPLITASGTQCSVATDRAYTTDHIWVKSLPANMVVMGISASMVEILGEPHKISLVPVGTVLSVGDAFGTIEGFKMTVDMLAPISGLVIDVDSFLLAQSSEFGNIPQINDDPYNSGWMIGVQLDKPQELTNLLTWQKYRDLIAK